MGRVLALETRLFTHDQRRILRCGGWLAMRIAIESVWRAFAGLCARLMVRSTARHTTRFPLVSHFVNAIRRETLSTAERFPSLASSEPSPPLTREYENLEYLGTISFYFLWLAEVDNIFIYNRELLLNYVVVSRRYRKCVGEELNGRRSSFLTMILDVFYVKLKQILLIINPLLMLYDFSEQFILKMALKVTLFLSSRYFGICVLRCLGKLADFLREDLLVLFISDTHMFLTIGINNFKCCFLMGAYFCKNNESVRKIEKKYSK